MDVLPVLAGYGFPRKRESILSLHHDVFMPTA